MTNLSASELSRIPLEDMRATLTRILLREGFTEAGARDCADIFAENTLEGVYSHGVNRFPRFVEHVRRGHVDPRATPERLSHFGGLEQWDGRLGPGPLNALFCTGRAMELARAHGIGCVGLARTNHWTRGGAYGARAARAGFVFMGWTNTIANMPAWGAVDPRLGNCPLVLALPHEEAPIVLDMATSLFSYGVMEDHHLRGQKLPLPGGYDAEGRLTDDPAAILAAQRPLPIGYWKGAGLSLLLDLLAAALSGGRSAAEISREEVEFGISQVFIAIDLTRLGSYPSLAGAISAIIDDYRQSIPVSPGASVRYPGERAPRVRAENERLGLPVQRQVWEQILAL
jgi:3-dehydro-L-gulonate 2-dehydrogenase